MPAAWTGSRTGGEGTSPHKAPRMYPSDQPRFQKKKKSGAPVAGKYLFRRGYRDKARELLGLSASLTRPGGVFNGANLSVAAE